MRVERGQGVLVAINGMHAPTMGREVQSVAAIARGHIEDQLVSRNQIDVLEQPTRGITHLSRRARQT